MSQSFSSDIRLQILNTPFALNSTADHLIWKLSPDGAYSVSQGYQVLLSSQEASSSIQTPNHTVDWVWLWKLNLPPKFILFLWKVIHAAIPTTAILKNHHINVEEHCFFCHEDDETLSHLFIHCPFSRAVWFGSSLSLLSSVDNQSFTHWLMNYLQHFRSLDATQPAKTSQQCQLFLIILYSIWDARNRILHDSVQVHPLQVIYKSHATLQSILQAQDNAVHQATLKSFSPQHRIPIFNSHAHSLEASVLFYTHKNSNQVYVFALVVNQGNWEALHVWRNIQAWHNNLHFFFWCIRDFIFKHTLQGFTSTQGSVLSKIVVQRKGYVSWLAHSTQPPLQLKPLLQDIRSHVLQYVEFTLGGQLGHNLLRQILDFLPYAYLSFNDFVTFAF